MNDVVGRFAPSPTGPLHFGSLVAALASWLSARRAGGRWLLRIDDIDPPRCVPGIDRTIREQLLALGLCWDGPVRQQSTRSTAYRAALAELIRAGHAFPCACSRAQLAGQPHRGRCAPPAVGVPAAWRLAVEAERIDFADRIVGHVSLDLAAQGDLILWRKEDLPGYPLACVIDDADQGVTEVVRGADLLEATGPQILLQRLLGLPTPAYAHVPIARAANGQKLSKQNLAPALQPAEALADLQLALAFLGEAVPTADTVEALLQAVLHAGPGRP
ncbi:MAG: tRNA glutamyl-Q(34) synthetase GluQRS [Xanthomonadales bacterium]|jgi:glutamyl-Q tRNA(Asp) synthetase|nr:tRNA glutamyl-Q(34) synthetase GluQRS [Xanthomonadales bacterium]